MPTYRDVDAQDIYYSAREMYLRLRVSHEHHRAVDTVLEQFNYSKLDSILKARSDEALVKALKATNAFAVFALLQPLIDYHYQNNTQANMRQVIDTLDRWGACERATSLPQTMITEKIAEIAKMQSRLWIQCQKVFGRRIPTRRPTPMPGPR